MVKSLLVAAIAAAFLVVAPSAFADGIVKLGDVGPVPDSICPGPGNDLCPGNGSTGPGSEGCRNVEVKWTQKTATGLATAWVYKHTGRWCWHNDQILDVFNKDTKFTNVDPFSDVDATVFDQENQWYSDLDKCYDDPNSGGSISHCMHRSWRQGKIKNTVFLGQIQVFYPVAMWKVNGRGFVKDWEAHN
jgi:hypothetical protein